MRGVWAAAGTAAFVGVLSACGGSYNVFDDHVEKATYKTGSEAKEARASVPRWLPDDASDITYMMSTKGEDRLIAFRTKDERFPSSCRTGDSAKALGKPRLKADWFPDDATSRVTANCGRWSGGKSGDKLFAWLDKDQVR